MAIAERVVGYNVRVLETNYLDYTRVIQLKLEYGSTVTLAFPEARPADWLRFAPFAITIYMTAGEYDDVYHLLQTEDPVFCTALDLFGLKVGAVHTELDLSLGEPTGEGYQDESLEALIVRARARPAAAQVSASNSPVTQPT
ncbi:MAG: hypothetical protein J2P24_18140 [Streptosporangiales bacterium]|nr:hypothetical protein [Streptosporangiales bacterium]